MDMGSARLTLASCIAAVTLTAAHAASAAPQITVPACDVLRAWSATVDPGDTYRVAPAVPLAKALADDRLVPVFGAPALAWTAEDLKAAIDAINACWYEARATKDKPSMDALGAGKGAVVQLSKTLAYAAKVQQAVAQQQTAIDALPDSPELDRALGALTSADPAAPNLESTAGLPREIVGPVWAIAKVLPHLLDGERERLFAAFTERRTAMQAAMGQSLEAEIAGAPADVDGIIALLQVRQRIAGMAASDSLAAIDQKAAARAEEMQTTLRQSTPPAWVPPDCTELYRWAGAADAQQGVTLGNQGTYALFLDERVVPAFGISLGAWTDQDLARYQAARAVCQATWRALPGAAAISNLPADAPELLQMAAQGSWIDAADQQVAQARGIIQAHSAGLEALAAVEAQIAALPDAPDSLGQLQQLANDPAQYAVDEARRQGFRAAVAAKQNAINAQALTAAIDGLAQVDVASLPDLVNLIVYANNAMMTIADPNDQQRFFEAVQQATHGATGRLLPEFAAKLNAMPATLEGFRQTRTAVTDLTGVTDSESAPSFRPFHDAANARATAIVAAMRENNCNALLEELEIDADAAEQLLWDGDKGTKLGIFVCDLTQSGSPVHEYDGGGMFSGEQTLKATLAMGGLQTLSLHEAEVAQGTDMLVGFKMADANQERPISVQDWALFTVMATGGRFVTPEMCEPVMAKPEDQLTLDDRMMGVDCAEEILAASWGFQ
ncbi:MAG: hypothetical protein AB7P12_15615 [Alphaproteobacteria bacterium]